MTGKLLAPFRAALSAVLARPLLILTVWSGGAALAALIYLWLGLPERTAGDLLLSAVWLLLLAAGALVLLWRSFAAFQEAEAGWASCLRRLGRLAPVVALMAAVVAAVLWRFSGFPWWLAGAAVILALLPIAGQAAAGASGFRQAASVLARPEYWLSGAIALLTGLLLPWLLVSWTPVHGGLLVETASLVVRFAFAWLAAVVSWLLLAALIAELGRQSPA